MATCLIVDDDRGSCEIAARTIRELGYKFTIETDSMEALVACSMNMPDFILLDMQMPKVDGFAFITLLRKMDNSAHVKIIASTGLHDIKTVQALKTIGIDGYLVKPYSMDLLADKVKKLNLH